MVVVASRYRTCRETLQWLRFERLVVRDFLLDTKFWQPRTLEHLNCALHVGGLYYTTNRVPGLGVCDVEHTMSIKKHVVYAHQLVELTWQCTKRYLSRLIRLRCSTTTWTDTDNLWQVLINLGVPHVVTLQHYFHDCVVRVTTDVTMYLFKDWVDFFPRAYFRREI